MATEHTQRIVSNILDAFESGKMTKESVIKCIESNMGAIEKPDFSLIEEASYILPYSKKISSITAKLKKIRIEVSQVLGTRQ